MKNTLKKIPKFKSEAEELEFWSRNDASEFLDLSQAKRVIFPNLKPTVKLISIRLPDSLIDRLKTLANERDIPYQSLIKQFLFEKVKEEA